MAIIANICLALQDANSLVWDTELTLSDNKHFIFRCSLLSQMNTKSCSIFFFFLFYVEALCGLMAVLERDPTSLKWATHAAFNQK